MDLARFCRQVLADDEVDSQDSFDSWLEHGCDKSIRPEDVDLEALEAQLRACDAVEWGLDEYQLNPLGHDDHDDRDEGLVSSTSSFDMNWLQE
jgi:hypothetical protein